MEVQKTQYKVTYSIKSRSKNIYKTNLEFTVWLIDKFDRTDDVKKDLAIEWGVLKPEIILHKVEKV